MEHLSQCKQFFHLPKNNLIIKGTIILTLTGFLTRIIGFYNRIFLTNLIGTTQFGIFQLVLSVYVVMFAITTCGNEQALTKIISQYASQNNPKINRLFFYICFFVSLSVSIILSFFIYQNAEIICRYFLKMPECSSCLKLLCFAIPSIAMKGSIHGYFLGYRISSVHGISDLLEQTMKIISILILTAYIRIADSYDATIAVIGVIAGEYISLLYSILCFHRKNKILKRNNIPYNTIPTTDALSFKKSISLFFKNSIPMTTNRCAISILQSMESILIPIQLNLYCKNSDLSLSIYGVLMGISFPFIMFPATITNSMATMLMPAVSEAYGANQQKQLKQIVEKSIHFCLLIGLFSAITFSLFGKEIGQYFFQNESSGTYLFQLAFLCPLIYLSTTMASILNGLGYATRNLLQTIISTLIRMGFIILLVPKTGTAGYIIGLFVSYLFLTFGSLKKLLTVLTFPLCAKRSIILPSLYFFGWGIILFFLYKKSIIYLTIRRPIILFIALLFDCIFALCPLLYSTYKALQPLH